MLLFTANLAERKLSLLTDHVEDADSATRWQLIKSTFSRRLARNESIFQSRLAKGERGNFATRFWEHTIRGETDFVRHIDYVHINPVKLGSSTASATGRHPRFIVTSSLVTIRPIAGDQADDGRDYGERDRDEMGFARAQPILQALGI